MLALIPALVLAAALGGNPVFDDAVARYRAAQPAEAAPVFMSLLGDESLDDKDRATVQVWLASCYAATGDETRSRSHLVRAVALDPAVTAPADAPASVKDALGELKPKPAVPWIESPQGILVTAAAGTAGVAVLLGALVATDLVVSNMWLDQWYDGLAQSQETADPRAFVDFMTSQNKRYARVRDNTRADVAVLVATGVIVIGSGALAAAGLLAPGGEAE